MKLASMRKDWPCVELTLDFEHEDVKVRAWIDAKRFDAEHGTDFVYPEQARHIQLASMVGRIKEMITRYCGFKGNAELHEEIASEFPCLNAIQLIHNDDFDFKAGMVIYTVDFAEDVHG